VHSAKKKTLGRKKDAIFRPAPELTKCPEHAMAQGKYGSEDTLAKFLDEGFH